ncbi:MAG: twin-arginine translocase subunit TatB [Rhodanobacter sp.]|nr:MAG: twin-arginine translocase subunit TatB [Rhodanobacter sp.]TAM05560.1 MAG: twin-arginine translocase subunit TatB [Rhodanobacter sp.]TAM39988.1 MAG: twin-arginine translocase subunit TatB [Rhodanobacter sp.]TAN23729.1 MAG: twin-arginine translocase subunit TatB [Rhodanobacter sp.]
MIDLSLGKLLMVALIALIVLGPEKLPGAARTAGALLRRVRGGWDSVRAEVERELQVEELKRAAREVAEQGSAARAGVDAVVRGVNEPVRMAATMLGEPVATERDGAGKEHSSASAAAASSTVVDTADVVKLSGGGVA